MSQQLKDKFFYTVCGYLLAGVNYLLMDTRFNLFGIGAGIVGLIFFIKALRIKPEKKS